MPLIITYHNLPSSGKTKPEGVAMLPGEIAATPGNAVADLPLDPTISASGAQFSTLLTRQIADSQALVNATQQTVVGATQHTWATQPSNTALPVRPTIKQLPAAPVPLNGMDNVLAAAMLGARQLAWDTLPQQPAAATAQPTASLPELSLSAASPEFLTPETAQPVVQPQYMPQPGSISPLAADPDTALEDSVTTSFAAIPGATQEQEEHTSLSTQLTSAPSLPNARENITQQQDLENTAPLSLQDAPIKRAYANPHADFSSAPITDDAISLTNNKTAAQPVAQTPASVAASPTSIAPAAHLVSAQSSPESGIASPDPSKLLGTSHSKTPDGTGQTSTKKQTRHPAQQEVSIATPEVPVPIPVATTPYSTPIETALLSHPQRGTVSTLPSGVLAATPGTGRNNGRFALASNALDTRSISNSIAPGNADGQFVPSNIAIEPDTGNAIALQPGIKHLPDVLNTTAQPTINYGLPPNVQATPTAADSTGVAAKTAISITKPLEPAEQSTTTNTAASAGTAIPPSANAAKLTAPTPHTSATEPLPPQASLQPPAAPSWMSASTAPVLPATIEATPIIAMPLDHPNWQGEFIQKLTWICSQQSQFAELHLNPPDLGPLNIQLSLSDNQLNVSFQSPHHAVREAVADSLPKLRESLAENNIMLGNATVSDDPHKGKNSDQFARPVPAHSAVLRVSGEPAGMLAPPQTVRRPRTGILDTFA
jgi:flagellar hook-length control protein FliK